MCGFCYVWVCVCVGFVMCGCVYVWVCIIHPLSLRIPSSLHRTVPYSNFSTAPVQSILTPPTQSSLHTTIQCAMCGDLNYYKFTDLFLFSSKHFDILVLIFSPVFPFPCHSDFFSMTMVCQVFKLLTLSILSGF